MTAPIPHKLEWTDELVERFWSYWSEKSHAYFSEVYGRAIVRRTLRFIARDGVCIDYGCGGGGLVAALLDVGYRTGAVDFTPKSVAQVVQRFAGRKGFLGARTIADAEAFPPADVVFSVEAIEHVLDSGIDIYFATISRLLKSGGLAIFTTPNNEDLDAVSVYCPVSGAIFHPMQHVRSFDQQRISGFLDMHGFETVEVFVTDFGLSLRERPNAWLADKGKRILRMGAPPPNLVSIARKKT